VQQYAIPANKVIAPAIPKGLVSLVKTAATIDVVHIITISCINGFFIILLLYYNGM
jgi:hypothetical protein